MLISSFAMSLLFFNITQLDTLMGWCCLGFCLSVQLAGYSLSELFVLARSSMPQQQIIALETLTAIIRKVFQFARALLYWHLSFGVNFHQFSTLCTEASEGKYM